MLKNEDIICMSSIDWDFAWQGHQEIMTRLARSGNRVLFIDNTGVRAPRISDLGRIRKRIANWKRGVHGIRKIEDGLYVYSPVVFPFPYLKIARFINKKLMFSVLFKWLKAVGFSEPIVWTFLPTGLSLDLIEKIEPKVLIYYCIDFFEASSKDAVKIKHTEKLVLKKADLVFVTSENLLVHCSRFNDKVHLFPFGVNIENFKRALYHAGRPPEDLEGIKKPIAGYIGGIHKWIDFDLIRYAADKFKGISFVFCGPAQVDITKFSDLRNVYFLGYKTTEVLPFYVKEFDVAMIPYKITEYTRNVYPTKLNEYLSLGKRVVSTALPEVERFSRENGGIIRMSSARDEFCDNLSRAITDPRNAAEAALLMGAAERNSWVARLENMSELVGAVMADKARQRESDWSTNIQRFYMVTRKRLIPLVALITVVYLAVFYTPLLWCIAKPLAVNTAPQRSDAIAVFGGGVGESGRPGEGYQERADTAINLYDKGLAGKIIYLSGYKYIMKEARIMKALSISMGVKDRDIIIDDTPVNTYEMILNLGAIAKINNWKNIILVSSPYHMLRLKLLCDKHLKGLTISYVPVESSSYYFRGPKIKLEQISGIMREYAAIASYKLKDYI